MELKLLLYLYEKPSGIHSKYQRKLEPKHKVQGSIAVMAKFIYDLSNVTISCVCNSVLAGRVYAAEIVEQTGRDHRAVTYDPSSCSNSAVPATHSSSGLTLCL